MEQTFIEIIKHRRSQYALSNQSPVSDEELQQIIDTALDYLPSAFNSQSTRIVLLLGEQHEKLWNIAKETLRKHTSPENFVKTENKINKSFLSGYGTVLFFEDQRVIAQLEEQFPLYRENFQKWARETNAMHQIAIWMMLDSAGLGASVQHYNPLIDEEVKSTWNLPPSWQLAAQLPFGIPVGKPEEKIMLPLENRRRIFK